MSAVQELQEATIKTIFVFTCRMNPNFRNMQTVQRASLQGHVHQTLSL